MPSHIFPSAKQDIHEVIIHLNQDYLLPRYTTD